jgi:cell cycle checkpoint protein
MTSPPAKRQRRSTIILSDDDESSSEALLPLRTSAKSNTPLGRGHSDNAAVVGSKPQSKPTRIKALAKPSPKSSPEKSKQKSRTKKEPEQSQSLHTFFGKATEEQRWNRKIDTPVAYMGDEEFGDDIVDDDSFDEALLDLIDGKSAAPVVLDRQKHASDNATHTISATQRQAPTSSQRFVKPAIPIKRLPDSNHGESSSVQDDQRPWSERYAPASLEELAVHKKKVRDVQKWLSDVLSGRDRRVCVP